MINQRKAIELSLQTVVILIILLIVMLVMAVFFGQHFTDNAGSIFSIGDSAINGTP